VGGKKKKTKGKSGNNPHPPPHPPPTPPSRPKRRDFEGGKGVALPLLPTPPKFLKEREREREIGGGGKMCVILIFY
jgi:hypothetical protein